MSTPIAIAVVEHEGQFLVGQRPPGVPLAGLWEFPGGKIEPGETPEAAAIRECLEETRLDVEPLFHYPEHVQAYDHDRVQLHFVACRPKNNDSMQLPREPFRWIRRGDLAALKFPAGNATLIELLLHT
jgi:8-oxo-dGTP diphosphatase